MHNKIIEVESELTPDEAERLADLLLEIGKDLERRQDQCRATKWLERAYNLLAAQHIDRLSQDVGELRLSIMHILGKFDRSRILPSVLKLSSKFGLCLDVRE